MKAPATAENGGASVKAKSEYEPTHHSAPPSRQQAPRFHRAVERVYDLGPRVVGELLIEAGADLHRIERFAGLDRFPREFLRGIGADTWPVSIFAVTST